MKNRFLVLSIAISCLLSFNVFSQAELVLDNLDHPTGIAFHENRAFVALKGANPNTGQIISYDIFNPSEPYLVHLDSLSGYPRSIAIDDDNLYIGFSSYLGRVRLNESSFLLDTISFSSFSFPRCLEINNNRLYVAENTKISYYDLTSPNFTKTILANNLVTSPLSLAVKNDVLYFTSASDILKINLNSPSEIDTFYQNLNKTVYALCIIGDDMYVDQTYLSPVREIIKLNLSDPNNTFETVISGIGSAIDINYLDGELYFVSPLEPNNGQQGKVFKLTDEIITSFHENEKIIPVVFPNPSRTYVHIKGLPIEEYSILIRNQNGRIVKHVCCESKINIEELINGLYFLEIRNNKKKQIQTAKFIKSN